MFATLNNDTTIELWDKFKVLPNGDQHLNKIGTWDPEKKFEFTNNHRPSLFFPYQTRTNLSELNLRVASYIPKVKKYVAFKLCCKIIFSELDKHSLFSIP